MTPDEKVFDNLPVVGLMALVAVANDVVAVICCCLMYLLLLVMTIDISEKEIAQSFTNIHFNKTRALVEGTNKAGGPGQAGGLTRQERQVNICVYFKCQYS
jgi:hypothetical protein